MRGFISLVLIFVVGNLVLWGGQELYYYKDTQEIKKIENYLEQKKRGITTLKSKIDNLSFVIDNKQLELNNYKDDGLIDKYNAGVDSYNSLLDDYKNKVDMYNAEKDEYNWKIKQINELIKKTGSRFYLIPIPLPAKSVKTKL